MDNVKPVTKQSDEFPAQNHYPNGGYNLQNEGYDLPTTRQGDAIQGQQPMSLQDIRDWKPATRDNDQAGSETKLPDHNKPMTLQDIREWRPAADQRPVGAYIESHKATGKEPKFLDMPSIYSKDR